GGGAVVPGHGGLKDAPPDPPGARLAWLRAVTRRGEPTRPQPAPAPGGQGASPEGRRFLRGPQPRRKELARAVRIFIEFIRGFRALHFVGPCVTVFGSARFKEGHPYHALGRELGRELARVGFTVMTGSSPGILGAARRGA